MTAARQPRRRIGRLAAVLLTAVVVSACGREKPTVPAVSNEPLEGLSYLQAVDMCVTYGREHLPDHTFRAAGRAGATPSKDLRAPDGTFGCTFARPTPTTPCDAADPTECSITTVLLDRAGVRHEYIRTSS